MRHLILSLCLLAATLLASCAGIPAVTEGKYTETRETVAQRQMLVGSWQGEAPVKGGGSRSWVLHRHDNGTYAIEFTRVDAGGVASKDSEYGIWGVSAGYYFTAVRGFLGPQGQTKIDTTDPALYDIYKIVSLTQDTFAYRNLSTGNRFTVRRIPSGTQPPIKNDALFP